MVAPCRLTEPAPGGSRHSEEEHHGMTMLVDPRTALLDVDYTGTHAEPGSRAWIITCRSLLVSCLSDIRNNRTTGATVFAEIEQYGGWQHLEGLDGRPFRSFEEFCRSPNGLRLERTEIERRLTAQQLAQDNGVKALAAPARAGPGRGKKTGDDSTRSSRGSTSAAYLVARLKRDAPDFARRLAAGEFKSARAAALAAGIISPPSALADLLRLWRRCTPKERAAFIAEIDAS